MVATRLRGIFAMLITPFTKSEEIDYDALRAEVDWAVAQGVDGVVATPSIGEFACLTDEERWKCFEVVADQATKHPNLITIATIAAPYLRNVKLHAQKALELGYSAAQLIPPYYWVPDEDEVYRHYEEAAQTGLPIVIYHNPKLSKFYMRREFVGRLLEIPGCIAMKEVKTDRHVELEPLFRVIDGKIDVFTTFRAFTTGLTLGSSGGFINLFAVPGCIAMWRLHNQGADSKKIEEIQNVLNEVFPRGGEDNKRHIGTTKLVSSVVSGIDYGPPRSPYMLPGPEARKAIEESLPRLQELIKDVK